MAYPTTTDNLAQFVDRYIDPETGGLTPGTSLNANTFNALVDEINAITTELGALPKGSYADVDARLDSIEGSANGGIPKISPAVAGNFPKQKADGTLEDSGADAADFAAASHNHDSAYISIVGTPTTGNLPALTAGGELTDSGSKPADFATAGHNHDSAYISVVGTPTAGNLAALTAGGEISDSGSKPADFATASHNHSGVYDPAGTASSAVTSHEGASDPHTGYQKESEKGAASGYASLNASALVVENPANAQTTPAASKIPLADGTGKIATGWTPAMIGATSGDAGAAGLVPAPAAGDQDKVLCGGGTWVTPAGGGGDNVSVNGTACSDVDLDDSTPAPPAGCVNVKWQKDTSTPNNVSAYVPASVPVVLDREFATTIGTSWTAALTHEVPAGAMGSTRTLRFTLTGYYQNYSGTSQSMYFRLKFGGTTMVEVTMAMGVSSSVYRAFAAQGWIANANATNVQRAEVVITYTTGTGNPTTGYGGVGTTGVGHGALRGTAAEDTTAAVTLEVALYRANAAGVSLIIDHAMLELV